MPGGVDGTWPWQPLKAVRLLGGGSIPFKWSAAAGLVLTVQPGLVVAAPYAAVFKLDYSEAGNAAAAVGLKTDDTTVASPPPPPTPTGEGGHCPFFSSSPGATVSGSGTAICAAPSALRKWQGLKFGLFLHWCAHAANT